MEMYNSQNEQGCSLAKQTPFLISGATILPPDSFVPDIDAVVFLRPHLANRHYRENNHFTLLPIVSRHPTVQITTVKNLKLESRIIGDGR